LLRRVRLREWVGGLAFCLGVSSVAHGQMVSGSAFGGVGAFICCEGHVGAWQVGGGVEAEVAPNVSVGGDVSIGGPTGNGTVFQQIGSHAFETADFGTTPYARVNASYHFGRGRVSRARPFVTVGYGGAFGRESATFGPTFGGGADWWIRERRGIRVELVDQRLAEFGTTQLVSVRVALLLR
jgi:hypothetical protein